MANVAFTLVMTPRATAGHNTGNVRGCESLYVIYLYARFAKRRAKNSTCILTRFSNGREEQPAADASSQVSESETN